MIQSALIECPKCKASKEETMPLYFRQMYYACSACGHQVEVGEEDCCVFCAFSNVICPSGQEKRDCCSG
jgi:hypothetical protein